jgi:2,4-dienoyl-CoA reductase-like NADH-dependent reductase (Old Yellow Enzyme family)/thioredoxin reductase
MTAREGDAPTPLLLRPYRLGPLALRNRVVMAPMETNLAGPGGEVTPELAAYYVERGAGGAGMVIVEFTCVDRTDGLACTPQLSLDSDALVAGHARLAAAIRATGAKACLQLHHAGRQTSARTIGRQPIGPSAFESPLFRVGPRAMDAADIERVVAAFAAAAARAREAGYDAVELHGAHGYLLGQFLSPWTNRRDDAWGGDFERRLAFPAAVIRAVKERIGAMPLLYRLSAAEMVDGGLEIEDSVRIAPRLAEAGADALHVSAGVAERLDVFVEPVDVPEGWRLPLARRIREAVRVPVIAVGVIRSLATASGAVERGDADLVALGRALLADPAWPAKVAAGEERRVRPCMSCNWCIDRLARHLPLGCAVNPRVGRELEPPPAPRPGRGSAVVVGGGPAGVVAALLLSRSGFATTLYERRARVGGGLVASAAAPGKEKMLRYRDHLEEELRQGDVAVRTGRAPAVEELAARRPDLVVLATGARTSALDVPGAALPHVAQAYDVVNGDLAVGPGPVVVLGGGETGCEVAELAASRGAAVVLVSRSPAERLARSAEATYRRHLVAKVRASPRIRLVAPATVLEIDADGVRLRGADGREWREPARQVLAALGREAGSPLADGLRRRAIPVAVVGDADRIGRIGDAVNGAYLAVRRWLEELDGPARPLPGR